MNISTAIIYGKLNYKITRSEWKTDPYYMATDPSISVIDGLLVQEDNFVLLTADDLMADDWEIVSEQPKRKKPWTGLLDPVSLLPKG